MKVRELIAKLEKFDPEAEVIVPLEDDDPTIMTVESDDHGSETDPQPVVILYVDYCFPSEDCGDNEEDL